MNKILEMEQAPNITGAVDPRIKWPTQSALADSFRAVNQQNPPDAWQRWVCTGLFAASALSGAGAFPGLPMEGTSVPSGTHRTNEAIIVGMSPFDRVPYSDASTAAIGYSQEAFLNGVREAFAIATLIATDDEPEGDTLVTTIQTLFRMNHPGVAEDLHRYAVQSRLSSLVYYEIIARIGEVDDKATHQMRFEFLSNLLRSNDSVIRSGATAGIVALDDERGALLLHRAASKEVVRILRLQMLEGAGRLDPNVDTAA